MVRNIKAEVRQRLEMIGRGRALCYLFAIHTGLRAGTIRKLRVHHLDLDSREPALYLPAEILKNRRPFTQRLRGDLVAEMKTWVQDTGRQANDRVFDVPSAPQVSKVLKKDMAKAGIPWQDEKGRYFDFHSFRKCKGSFLRKAKVDPAVSMRQLGHADIRMTMEVYNDEELLDCQEALEATPKLTITPPKGPENVST
jgi:integrase